MWSIVVQVTGHVAQELFRDHDRSTMAMTMLWSYGYNDVRSLKGGFGGWAEAGYPVAEYDAETMN